MPFHCITKIQLFLCIQGSQLFQKCQLHCQLQCQAEKNKINNLIMDRHDWDSSVWLKKRTRTVSNQYSIIQIPNVLLQSMMMFSQRNLVDPPASMSRRQFTIGAHNMCTAEFLVQKHTIVAQIVASSAAVFHLQHWHLTRRSVEARECFRWSTMIDQHVQLSW